MIFEVGEKYRLKYTFASKYKEWDYIVKVVDINEKCVYLEFYDLQGHGTHIGIEEHRLSDFSEGGDTVVQKLSPLELLL